MKSLSDGGLIDDIVRLSVKPNKICINQDLGLGWRRREATKEKVSYQPRRTKRLRKHTELPEHAEKAMPYREEMRVH